MSKTANATSKSVPPATSTYDREAIAKLLRSANRGKLNLTEKEVIATYKSLKGVAPAEFLNDPANKIRVGKKDVLDITPFYSHRAENRGSVNRPDVISSEDHLGKMVPNAIPNFVPFGNHDILYRIIRSGKTAPVFITGLSGCGKTTDVIQVCHMLGRELFRVNITAETDEDDLLGGYRLVAKKNPDTGEETTETVFHLGPVVMAMLRGAVLLLDEVDLASSKIMCLQPVFDSRSVFLKKISQMIVAKDGFQIIATANTKGQGSETGKFIGTNVMNEAFLDRFDVTLEQDYPPADIEARILQNVLSKSDVVDDDLVKTLVEWARQVRLTYQNGGIAEIISTRRLVQIVTTYTMIGDFPEALRLCINRFDPDTAATMMRLYNAIDPKTLGGIVIPKGVYSADSFEIPDNHLPFEK